MSNFYLKKWYLDAADERGNVYIGYWAMLKWRSITLHGYQHLWHSKNGVETQGGFTKQPAPVWKNSDQLIWQPKGVEASWKSCAEPLDEILLSTNQGKINWQCSQPKAKAKIQLPHLSFTGWGYTEFIEITIPVLDLPLKTLYWGRCHTDNHYLVWIKWDGPVNKSLVWYDGKRGKKLVITDGLISGSDFKLKLGQNIPLRQGKLISTVFKSFSKITRLFPKAAFLVDERKWYSLGQLEIENNLEPATIIHETVLW